jgi:DNA-directed RNA polymerase specialized sigma24 family protein
VVQKSAARSVAKPKATPRVADPATAAVLADRALVDQCIRGDVRAWSQLYQQTHDSLLTTIGSFLGRAGQDRNLVEEIAARVWYAVVKDNFTLLAKFDVRRGCRISTFLSVLAKSETRMLFRSEKRRKSREQLVSRPEVDGHHGNSSALASDEEFLGTLSPAERAFYSDVLLATSDNGEVAKQGYSSTNIWQLNFRVRKKLERFILD